LWIRCAFALHHLIVWPAAAVVVVVVVQVYLVSTP
jgi:hypothetical protein